MVELSVLFSRQIAGIWNAAMSGKSKERREQREDRQEKNLNKTGQDKTAALAATPAASVQGSYKDKSKAEQSTISTACYRTPPRPKSRAEQSRAANSTIALFRAQKTKRFRPHGLNLLPQDRLAPASVILMLTPYTSELDPI